MVVSLQNAGVHQRSQVSRIIAQVTRARARALREACRNLRYQVAITLERMAIEREQRVSRQ